MLRLMVSARLSRMVQVKLSVPPQRLIRWGTSERTQMMSKLAEHMPRCATSTMTQRRCLFAITGEDHNENSPQKSLVRCWGALRKQNAFNLIAIESL